MADDNAKTEDETPEIVAEAPNRLGEFINALDMEELDFVETISGVSLDELEIPGRAKGLFVAGVALVAKRRTQADFSWAQARALNMNQIKKIIEEAFDAKKAPTESKPKAG